MTASRITEKKLKNKRFKRTEDAIIAAFFLSREVLSVDRLVKLAGISRSTLHRHHKNIYEIAPDYKQYILAKYRRMINRLLKTKRTKLSRIYYKILIFLIAYQRIIEFLLRSGDTGLIEDMVTYLSPKISSTHKITNSEILAIYNKEVSGVIEQWIAGGFQKDAISATVDKITYLTDTAKTRLAPIA